MAPGPERPNVATTLNKLALQYDAQGRYADTAVRLTKHLLTEAAGDPALGRAEALGQPMDSMTWKTPTIPSTPNPCFGHRS